MRLRCKKGFFKGCLIVTRDNRIYGGPLIPDKWIVVRQSMRKGDCPAPFRGTDHASFNASLGINCTFEHRSFVDNEGSIKASISDYSVKLNRRLCLLLHERGVPSSFFIDLMRTELDRIIVIHKDNRAAYGLLKRELRISLSNMPKARGYSSEENQLDDFESDSGVVEEDDLDPLDNTDGNMSSGIEANYAIHAINMLLAGFDLAEQTLSTILRRIQESRLIALKDCRMRLPEAIYLVGVPDPCDILNPGEVFVVLPNDNKSRSLLGEWPPAKYVTGPVAVTRNPLSHRGDIRLLRAVSCPKLSEFVSGTSAGVIFFSVKGQQTEVCNKKCRM